MNTKYKIGDTFKTAQDHIETYTATVVDIKRYPHPYSTEPEPKKDMTWYTVTYNWRKGNFITNDIDSIIVGGK
jgi:hypothetical protein